LIELQLLGGLDITGPHLSPHARARRHPMAVLALAAAASPQAISRDRLMGFLWPESNADRASNSLRQTIFWLRRNVADDIFLPESANGLLLDPKSVKVDLWEFREAIASGEPAKAVALYGGPFLDSFQIPGASEFSRWVETESALIQRQHITALDALGTQAAAEKRYDDAVAWRRRQAAADPFSSRGALTLLQALAQAGDRTGALEYATVYESLVRHHLEVGPDPAVTEFVATLRTTPNAVIAARPRADVVATRSTQPPALAATEAAVSHPADPADPAIRAIPLRAPRPHRRMAIAATVVFALMIIAARSMMGEHPRDMDGVTIVASGMTSVEGRDTASSLIFCEGVACPKGPLPQPAFIVPAHPSYTRPAAGTSYILPVPDGTTRPAPGYKCCTTAIFENRFRLPPDAVSATITIMLLADNQASVAINGTEFGAQKDKFSQSNFIETASFTTTFAPDPSGINKLQVKLWDGGAALGLNYRAFVTYVSGREAPE
jgi:DNA-binding SARP family transcriptional activator